MITLTQKTNTEITLTQKTNTEITLTQKTNTEITLTQKTNTEIFAFIVVLVYKLLSCKVLFTNRKGNRNC